MGMSEAGKLNTIELATELTIAWLGNQNVRATAEDVPAFLRAIHETVAALDVPAPEPIPDETSSAAEAVTPAVSVRKSLASPDHIISMIDGKPYKMLRRHLARHGLTPEQYRERFNLKPDYPMVAPTYSNSRRTFAQKIGLGRKVNEEGVSAPAPTALAADATAPVKRRPGRPKKEAPVT
jgi:predicted transcriptional regulator